MLASCCLLTCAFTLAQPPERGDWLLSPQLPVGLELVYSGSCTEESLVPHVQFLKQYRLEVHMLVTAARGKEVDLAILTALGLRDRLPDKTSADKPSDKKLDSAWSVRLEMARLDEQGKWLGAGADRLTMPIHGPATVESGAIVQFPLGRVNRGQTWTVTEEGRPTRYWTVEGTEVVAGVPFLKLSGLQQSEDWDRPRADRAGWRRRDTVWLDLSLGVAKKVERVIERRDPARRDPTQRTTVSYALDSPFKYPGKLLEDRRQDIQLSRKYEIEAEPLLKQPVLLRAQIDTLLRRLNLSMENAAPTPYRKALLQLQARLEGARRGDVLPDHRADEPMPTARALTVGQRAPDVLISELGSDNATRLHKMLGKPVVVFFYNPAAATSRDMLRYVAGLDARHGGKIGFLAMAIAEDAALALKQREALRLPFPIHDGRSFHITFGVEATPRLILIDAEGIVRATHTGWGFQSPVEIDAEMRRCLP